jgi:hypothetical protein
MAELYQQRVKFFESGRLSKDCRLARCVGASVVIGEFIGSHQMPNSFSTGRIERLKREAKQLCRTSTLTHSEALDSIAKANGFGNWSLLMKCSEAASPALATSQENPPIPPDFVFSRTSDEMREALRVIPYKRYGALQDEAARTEVADICSKFISAPNAIDFAIRYIECLLTMPRISINSGARVYHEMRRWLPYYLQPISEERSILVNRHYKPVGMTASEWVNYNDFRHLHLPHKRLRLDQFAHAGSSPGYLFNDGCSPWHGRKVAEAYLARLHTLKAIMGR